AQNFSSASRRPGRRSLDERGKGKVFGVRWAFFASLEAATRPIATAATIQPRCRWGTLWLASHDELAGHGHVVAVQVGCGEAHLVAARRRRGPGEAPLAEGELALTGEDEPRSAPHPDLDARHLRQVEADPPPMVRVESPRPQQPELRV